MEKCTKHRKQHASQELLQTTSSVGVFTKTPQTKSDITRKKKGRGEVKGTRRKKEIARSGTKFGRTLRPNISDNSSLKKQDMKSQKHVLNTVRKQKRVSIEKGVRKITKISNNNVRQVPDRINIGLGSDSSDTKTIECTKLTEPSVRNECLTLEAVNIRDIFTKGIFEKDFDGLDSTTLTEVSSSHDSISNVASNMVTEERKRMIANNETTPIKQRIAAATAPLTPNKNKDHSQYQVSMKVRHVCEYCQKVFRSNGKLNSHVYSHTGERPYDCSHCSKAFSSKFKLVRHLLIHSEVRKFVCQICSRTFLRNDHLKNHYKIHDPMKKMHKCPKQNCDKEYSSLMSFKKHMAVHSVEDGDLKCLICSVKYETKEDILYHLKSHSGSRLFKSQSDKKFKCDHCERLFLTRKDVTRHLVVHTGDRDFLCQFCPQRFGRKDHLVRHIRKSHHPSGKVADPKCDVEPEEKVDEVCEVKETEKAQASPSDTALPTAAPPSPAVTTATVPVSVPTEQPVVVVQEDTMVERAEASTSHLFITVNGGKKSSQSRKKKVSSQKPNKKEGKEAFQNSELSVPNKKQVPLRKSRKRESRNSKNPTTQIVLQNIPNVFIIPSNSIILVRNQVVRMSPLTTAAATPASPSPLAATAVAASPVLPDAAVPLPTLPDRQDFTFTPSFTFDSNPSSDIFHSSQFQSSFSDSTNFTDIPDLNPTFDETDSMTVESNDFDLLKKSDSNVFNLIDVGSTDNCAKVDDSNKCILSEASRQIRLLETGINMIPPTLPISKKVGIVRPVSKTSLTQTELSKDIFEDTNENLLLSDSILNELKADSSVIVGNENEFCDSFGSKDGGGVLSAILNSTSDNEGSDFLRNFLNLNNDTLSPLPGFSQIFQSSNCNPG